MSLVNSKRYREPLLGRETELDAGTFDRHREHLFGQFNEIPFDPETGLSPEELEREVNAYLVAHLGHPRVLQKANVFRIVVTRGQIYIDPVDWFIGKLNHGGLMRGMSYEEECSHGSLVRKLSLKWLEEAECGVIAEEAEWLNRAYRIGQASGPRAGLDRGHISPGWENMLSQGLTGLIEQTIQAREALGDVVTNEQLAFYEATEMVYHATIKLAERFGKLASEMMADYPQHEVHLKEIASACHHVPAHRPHTFHQALQFMWLMHELIEMEGELVRSMGQFDRTLYPYYRADIDSGRLTPDQAKELIKFFWVKFYARTQGRENGKNFVFGGQYSDGSEITNDLTYLALEAYEELNTPDPKLSVRFLPGTSDRLYKRVADLIRKGHNAFVLMNDEAAVEALVKRGRTLKDARLYLPIGCYEPAVEGKEVGCKMNLTVNLAKGVELALHDGVDPLSGQQVGPSTGDPRQFANFEDLWSAYTEQMDFFLTRAAECIRAAEGQWPQINPSPLISATIEDCLARGKDISQGGAHYNAVGFVGAALGSTCDSLLALRQTVYDEKRFAIEEILDAIDCNFEGHERMRQYLLNRVPKWGNNNPEADRLAKRIAEYYCNKIHTFTNSRGGPCQAGLFSLTFAWEGGQLTGALPDGKRAHESLSSGIGAVSGRERSGVTALIDSVTKLDSTLTPNGAVLDVTLHPTAVAGEEGLDAFAALIKTFFAKGGYALQFNIFDNETLRDAQHHPERYASLQIRVTGWSVYFTTLSKYEQDQFIIRNTHGV